MGNMILIKDRHLVFSMLLPPGPGGKYDTYKGSTLKVELVIIDFRLFGKYDTYKGFIDIEY